MSEDREEYWDVREELWTRTRRQLEETVQKNEKIWQRKETSNTEENQPSEEGTVQLQVSRLDL